MISMGPLSVRVGFLMSSLNAPILAISRQIRAGPQLHGEVCAPNNTAKIREKVKNMAEATGMGE